MNEEQQYELEQQQCAEYILNNLSPELAKRITKHEVMTVLDAIDFFEVYSGTIDIENDVINENTFDEEELLQFVLEDLEDERRDGNPVNLSEEDVIEILDLEYEYGLKNNKYKD